MLAGDDDQASGYPHSRHPIPDALDAKCDSPQGLLEVRSPGRPSAVLDPRYISPADTAARLPPLQWRGCSSAI